MVIVVVCNVYIADLDLGWLGGRLLANAPARPPSGARGDRWSEATADDKGEDKSKSETTIDISTTQTRCALSRAESRRRTAQLRRRNGAEVGRQQDGKTGVVGGQMSPQAHPFSAGNVRAGWVEFAAALGKQQATRMENRGGGRANVATSPHTPRGSSPRGMCGFWSGRGKQEASKNTARAKV